MNIARYLEESARRYPHKTAVRHEGEEITFEELDKACNRLANGLKDLGLEPGDRSVLMMPNSIHAITAYYALAKIGAVVVPVNFLYRAHELEHIFTDSKPKSFIGAEPHLDEIANLLKKIEGKPPLLLALGATDSRFKDLKTAYSDRADFPTHPSGDTDTFNILYTSGTTGVPKGVMLTHGNLAKDAEILAEMRGEIEPDTVVIGALPLYHVYGITSVLNVSMYLGFTIELFTHFDPEAVIRVTEEEARTLFFGVPTMLNRLIQVASEKPPERTSLKFCISGGASLPVEFLKRFETLFNTTIHEGYGLTECPVCVENPYGKKTKPGSIGLPIPEFSARIVGEDGKDVSPGEKGELLIKGPAVMKGYLNRPEETAETIRDGWLYTGDIARMDEDLYIYIVDRKKELVIRGGYNVYPREIEEILYQIPDILEAAVYGVPHEDLGEEVAAVVVLKEGAQTDGNAIREYVKERLAPYKYPRIIKTVKDPLPKSGSGKILKKEVKKIYA
ncbi:MAG: long-chain fatty acid--CoA ligase [Pseudomonadota bacterium]